MTDGTYSHPVATQPPKERTLTKRDHALWRANPHPRLVGVRVRSTLAQRIGIDGVRLGVFVDTVVFSGIAHVGRAIFKSKACFVVIVRGYMYRVTLNFNFRIFDGLGSSIL